MKIEFRCEVKAFGICFVNHSLYDIIPFSNAVIAHDYCKNAVKPADKQPEKELMVKNGKKSWCDQFIIYTKYNRKISKLNKKFKRYCKINSLEYEPYVLCVLKNDTCQYCLHNETFIKFYEKANLKSLVNKFEKYVNDLFSNKPKKEEIQTRQLTKLEKDRNDLIDSEISRSYEYIKFLNKLKR